MDLAHSKPQVLDGIGARESRAFNLGLRSSVKTGCKASMYRISETLRLFQSRVVRRVEGGVQGSGFTVYG